jgi:hypothetical protein
MNLEFVMIVKIMKITTTIKTTKMMMMMIKRRRRLGLLLGAKIVSRPISLALPASIRNCDLEPQSARNKALVLEGKV